MDREDYWRLGSWRGIPISMHWTVLLVAVWLFLVFMDVVATVFGSVAFVALLLAHEFGHVAVLRQRKIPIEDIRLFGLHGKVSHEWGSRADHILVAWGGVGAQVVVLLLALLVQATIDLSSLPVVSQVLGPMLFVWTRVNLVLMIIALLPIGPFDGRAAWAAFPWMRNALRRRRKAAREARMDPERNLSPEHRATLEASSSAAAADLLAKIAKKPSERKQDARE
jgi:stage IV sporulation protein FB